MKILPNNYKHNQYLLLINQNQAQKARTVTQIQTPTRTAMIAMDHVEVKD